LNKSAAQRRISPFCLFSDGNGSVVRSNYPKQIPKKELKGASAATKRRNVCTVDINKMLRGEEFSSRESRAFKLSRKTIISAFVVVKVIRRLPLLFKTIINLSP
jgi:hypothetical protein